MITPLAPTHQGPSPAPERPATRSKANDQASSRSASPDPETLREAVEAANRSARALASTVQFNIDSQSGKAIVRVVDTETGQLLRQIPSEEMLELRRALDRIAGLVIDDTA